MRPPFVGSEFGPGMRGGRRGVPGAGFGPEGFGPGGGRPEGFGPGGRGDGSRGRGRGPGRGPGRPQADAPDASDAAGWFAGRLPDGLYVGTPTIVVDREEITVIGDLPPLTEQQADPAAQAAAESGRIARFREESRETRIEVARQAEHRYQRHVTWGARLGSTEQLFTQISVPVMTRLAQAERQVLDTLIDAGVARSRSEALAWSVRTVGEHAESWLGELRDAMEQVSKVRSQGPGFDKVEPPA